MATELIQTRLAGLPTQPGVYIMRDAKRRVIYVGKAINLRNRVRSYFQDSAGHTGKTQQLVLEVADLDWIVTQSELEALILECELIKKYRPRFNIRLKDDKRYPYIKVTLQEDFPRFLIVRNMQRDGARYFGPFTSGQAVRRSLELLRRLFPYRTCDLEEQARQRRPCLYYHLGLCPGPCIGAISKEDYRAIIDRACLFLEGKQEQVLVQLNEEMEAAAEALEFERAAKLRDTIDAVTRVIETQRVVSGHLKDHDFVAFAREDGQACVQVFFIRGGKLIGREYFILTGTTEEDASEILGSFVKQFYDEAAYVPPEILVQEDLDELAVLQEWLRRRRGTKVLIKTPRRGEKRQVMNMAIENAVATLERLRAEWEVDTNKHTEALAELQEALGLPNPPARIECYDISNTQGTNATGSMVVFAKGVPSKQDYRRFRIKTVQGPNDYASMAEVLKRRFARAKEAEAAESVDGKENRWAIMPDLVIVDGGKGQLSAALEAMREVGVGHLPVVGLAKEREEIFLPGRPGPVVLPNDSQGLYLVQRIRDEAHRFAVTYHRNLRGKESVRSVLEEVPGIGPRRRQALLKQFGSVDGIRSASVEELAAVPGMNRRAAEQLREYL
jgi:excinuclease ABC subunit C